MDDEREAKTSIYLMKLLFMKKLIALSLLIITTTANAQPKQLPIGTVLPTRQVSVHDPVMIKEGSTYYLFCTGWGIAVWSSKNMQQWRKEAPVFSTPPQWAVDTIPGFKGHIWAPDISYHNGRYYLYYSVSAFGKNTSAIGIATAKTLDSASKDFGWTDHGRVVQSYPGKSAWNAIDPAIIANERGEAYLAFGSFWDGLKLAKLTTDRLHLAQAPETLPTVASRRQSSLDANAPAVDKNLIDAGSNAIEAPFIFKKGDYYYLFASIDYCCKGPQSTYKMIVGRARTIEGPYEDKEGKALTTGGGTVLLQGDQDWYGIGHNSVYSWDGKDYLVFHGYDAADKGASKLRIETLRWEGGWPVVDGE